MMGTCVVRGAARSATSASRVSGPASAMIASVQLPALATARA